MVIGDEPEKLTDKYSESHKSEPYIKYKYLEAKKYQTTSIKALKKLLDEADKIGIPETAAQQLSERLKTLEKMSSFEYYRELTDGMYYDEDGNALTEENPLAKFKTCRKGGNFSLPLILKDGSETYQARAKDIDWDAMHGANADVYRAAWEMVVEERSPSNSEEQQIYDAMKDKLTYFEKFNSKDEYVIRSSSYWNYAYLDKDTGWLSVDDEKEGETHWINNFYDRFIKELDGDSLVTIFECSVQN